MKKFLLLMVMSAWLPLAGAAQANETIIRIGTEDTELLLKVHPRNGRLYQLYLGKRLANDAGMEYLTPAHEAYITNGAEDYYEPAIRVLHADGNPSLILKYVSHEQKDLGGGVMQTVVKLADDQYPSFTVELYYTAYPRENIIKTHTVISHNEPGAVTLFNYASSMLHFDRAAYWLTDFTGDWAREVWMTQQKLAYGKRMVDTKLGARASMFTSPFFVVSLDGEAQENSGDVLLGTIGWTGNFRFTFEIDHRNSLRVISGINPMASEYSLEPGASFRTPDFYFTLSGEGMGKATRSFHDWARNYQIKDGDKGRLTLLNNWEATFFDFNEKKLIGLFDDAKFLGVDMFLLDDG